MLPQQFVNFRVPRRKLHAIHRCSRMEQHLNRLGRAPVFPVRVHACAYGQCERRASFPSTASTAAPRSMSSFTLACCARHAATCSAVLFFATSKYSSPPCILPRRPLRLQSDDAHPQYVPFFRPVRSVPRRQGLSPVRLSPISSPFDSTLFPAYSAVEGFRVVFSRAPAGSTALRLHLQLTALRWRL